MSEPMNRPAGLGSDDKSGVDVKGLAGCIGFVGGGCATLLMVMIVGAIHFLIKYW